MRRQVLVRTLVALGALTSAVAGAGCGNGEPGASASPGNAPTATSTVTTRPATVARPATPPGSSTAAPAADDLAGGSNPLPADSAFALPPMIHLVADAADGGAAGGGSIRTVLRSKQLALAPAALRSIRAGEVSAGALELLLRIRPAGAQLLVFEARGRRLRVQATSLVATRDLVTSLRDVTGRSVQLELRPVRADFADLAQSKSAARQADAGRRAVAFALTQVGVPYSWGGGGSRGPTTGTCAGYHGSIQPCPATRTVGFDCSGLTLFAYAQVGITLDHYAAFQWLEGKRIDVSALAPGDLVFFHPKGDGPGHVGLYVGNGQVVEEPHPGDHEKIVSLTTYGWQAAGRLHV